VLRVLFHQLQRANTLAALHGSQYLFRSLYIVADGGEAAVLDPKWEIEEYLQIAEDKGFKIAHILETHNHALWCKGAREFVWQF